jgi:hypothetical protein
MNSQEVNEPHPQKKEKKRKVQMRNLMGSPHLKLKIADRVTLFFFSWLSSLLFGQGRGV